jgi:hypothetical protein
MEDAVQWLLKSFPGYAVVLSAFPLCFKVFGWVEDQLSANAKHDITGWLRSVATFAKDSGRFDLLEFHNKLFGDRYFSGKSLRRTLLFSLTAYLFVVLLPHGYFVLRVYLSNTIELILEFALIFMIFILVIFPLDLCGVILTRKLSKFAGSSFTIKRSIVVFISDIIGKTVVFPIVGLLFCLIIAVLILAISGLLWDILSDLTPGWVKNAFAPPSPPGSIQPLLDSLGSLSRSLQSADLNEAYSEGFVTQQLKTNEPVGKAVIDFYFLVLPSVAICSAWVWLYAISLHVVRVSVFMFDVDTRPVRVCWNSSGDCAYTFAR